MNREKWDFNNLYKKISANAMLNVRPTLHFVGTCAGEAWVGRS